MLKLVTDEQVGSVPENIPDECLIMAYIDGELDEAGYRHVDNLLKSSVEARRIAEVMQMSCRLVQSAFAKVADERI